MRSRLLLLACALLPALAAAGADTYTMADFPNVAKIDAHLHPHSTSRAFIGQARKDNFRALAVNVDYGDFPPVAEQLRVAAVLRRSYRAEVAFAATFFDARL